MIIALTCFDPYPNPSPSLIPALHPVPYIFDPKPLTTPRALKSVEMETKWQEAWQASTQDESLDFPTVLQRPRHYLSTSDYLFT